MAREVGIGDLSFFSRVHYGGGTACGTVLHAAMAVATGVAETVVCYRAFNERSGHRFGRPDPRIGGEPSSQGLEMSWHLPYGLMTPAGWVAMFARRYMHTYGATSEDLGRVAVAMRRHAATNPAAWFHGRPITLEELGFCERGEARHLVADGGIEIDGRLPVNPHGGQLGEAYIHGMNGIAEAVRQIRGTSVNQVADVRNVLVTAGTGVPTSGLVLSAG